MKKSILTGCAAVLFSIGTMAQVQDTSSTDFRQGVPQNQEGMDSANNQLQQDVPQTQDSVQQGVEQTQDSIQNGPSSQRSQGQETGATDTDTSIGANSAAPSQPIEVLEEKEGPDNQVVYKYQGELFYVDREEAKLVKIEESQLKDAEHRAIISDEQ